MGRSLGEGISTNAILARCHKSCTGKCPTSPSIAGFQGFNHAFSSRLERDRSGL